MRYIDGKKLPIKPKGKLKNVSCRLYVVFYHN